MAARSRDALLKRLGINVKLRRLELGLTRISHHDRR